MSTEIRLLGWEALGLRCPDHQVSFRRDDGTVFPVSLVQMPNGTGKTTTLELLRAALSGDGSDGTWDKARVKSFAKRDNPQRDGLFVVTLQHNQKQITVRMKFDFNNGTVKFATTRREGMGDGFHPPNDIARFLRAGFVRFFIFDGELAEHLLNQKMTDAQDVIENLFLLDLFRKVADRVGEYWERQVDGRTAKEERGLTRRRNKLRELRKRNSFLKKERARVAKELQEKQTDLKTRDAKLNATLSKKKQIGERLQRAEEAWRSASKVVEDTAEQCFELMQSPQCLTRQFADEMVTLKSSLDKAKLPESTAREFFEDLAQEAECICGRELTEECRIHIRAHASRYLGSEDIALLNAMKSDVASIVSAPNAVSSAQLDEMIDLLKTACRDEDDRRTERDALRSQGVSSDPELEAEQAAINGLRAEVSSLSAQLRKFDDPSESSDDEDSMCIKTISKLLKDAEQKVAEISQTIDLKSRRDKLQKILLTANRYAREDLSTDLCDEANTRVRQLLPTNNIRIREIGKSLVLVGQEGGSVGENLSVAYAFLATLFVRAEHKLPFIVDSPANPLDLAVRPRVGELIPSLGSQFVAFTISSEREGFLPSLERAAPGAIQYVTLFRQGVHPLPAPGGDPGAVVQTADGVCVKGRDFFKSFHLEKEGGA